MQFCYEFFLDGVQLVGVVEVVFFDLIECWLVVLEVVIIDVSFVLEEVDLNGVEKVFLSKGVEINDIEFK